MESILNIQSICHSKCMVDCSDESGFSGDYTLPEYCPDIAVILKCFAEPRLQNRQFRADKLLVDGVMNLRVIYLDEGRQHINVVEFAVPYSCTLRSDVELDAAMVHVGLATKYVNCRAITARRIEVHGAVQVHARAYGNCTDSIATDTDHECLCCMKDTLAVSRVIGTAEKVVTISEPLEFPHSLPAADRLLGGTCTALVTEWKVLNGKVIARGAVMVHQLYVDNQETGTTQCLDYEVPFSQILDIRGACDGQLCCGDVQVLTDTERCTVGPDGSNTVLEFSAKLMLQVCVYERDQVSLLLEAYHTHHPVEQEFRQIECKSYCGNRHEQTTLPMLLPLPEVHLQELLEVTVYPQNAETTVVGNVATIGGTMLVSVIGRDSEGEIVYFEKCEEYRLECPCDGNEIESEITVSDLNYRVVDHTLELQVGVWVWLNQYQTVSIKALCSLSVLTEQTYPKTRAGVWMYYAQAGESLWEIAKECHTSPDAIQSENGLRTDRVEEACVLLVPVV